MRVKVCWYLVSLAIAVMLVLMGISAVSAQSGGEWTSPTGSSGDWTDGAYAYDSNTGTYAYKSTAKSTWSTYITLTWDLVSVTHVRWWVAGYSTAPVSIRVDVQLEDDSWSNVKDGSTTRGEWVSEELTEETKIKGARVSLYNSTTVPTSANMRLYEFECYVVPGVEAPTIVSSAATSVDHESARLNYDLTDDGGADTTVVAFWGKTDGEADAGAWTFNSSLGVKAEGVGYCDASGLDRVTEYFWRYRATNSEGTSWTITRAFNTTAEAPTILSSAATSVDHESARLNYDLTDDGGAGTTVEAFWGKADGGESVLGWDHSFELGVKDEGEGWYDAVGLDDDTTYYFRFYAVNEEGNDWSIARSFETEVDYRVPEITSGAATAIGYQEARLHFNLVDRGNRDTTVWVYWGEVDGEAEAGAWTFNYSLGVKVEGAGYYDVSELEDDTTYYFRLYAVNVEGSDWTVSRSFKTLRIPGNPFAVVVVAVDEEVVEGESARIQATVTDEEGDGVVGAAVSWNVTEGEAEIVESDAVTGVGGVAWATVRLSVAGNSTVMVSVDGYELSDTCVVRWVEAAGVVPLWYLVVLFGLLGVGWYTKSAILYIVGMMGGVVGVIWVQFWPVDGRMAVGLSVLFVLLIAWCVGQLIHRGEVIG